MSSGVTREFKIGDRVRYTGSDRQGIVTGVGRLSQTGKRYAAIDHTQWRYFDEIELVTSEVAA